MASRGWGSHEIPREEAAGASKSGKSVGKQVFLLFFFGVLVGSCLVVLFEFWFLLVLGSGFSGFCGF